MAATAASISAGTEEVILERGRLRVELALRPFSMTVRRAGRRLLRSGGLWVAERTIRDHFVQFTEGVVAREDRAPAERAIRAIVAGYEDETLELDVLLHGGRRARLQLSIPSEDRVALSFWADGDPLRLALEWNRRSEERIVGLGARHSTRFEQTGRAVQLGADRRYTGPDCPPEMLSAGGIPQGDYAPVPARSGFIASPHPTTPPALRPVTSSPIGTGRWSRSGGWARVPRWI